ncbi:MAG: beta-ketoacyl-ACP synthase II [SAR324 cluster bacterium]|uniref:3-oxoacyl-[acyl-carrier-protein] synthase 2 n=1 Tax=SAR324 cluster bacterium TaxID=2024889 RepID=A0A7X9FTZ4_9DELT|nr:beta-ketoacyl-ACP synthase II [SAR324 cluster bacterium]
MNNKRRVVVSGMGVVSPLGNNVKTTWEAILAGQSGIGLITRFDTTDFSSKIAAEVKDFKPEDYIEAKEVKKLDLFSQYAIASAQEAWDGSQLSTTNMDPARIGCILGVGIGGISTLQKYHEAFLNGGVRKISPFLIPAMISNLAPGNLAIRFGLKGVNYTLTSACASATHAIGEAYRVIADGIQEVVLTGGSEAAITTIGIGGFCSMKALSTRNDDPQRASRPFDKDRDGFVMGEGAAILILESLESAEKRGAPILAEVAGYGASCDAYHITAPSEDGLGAIACMNNALISAGMRPEDIDYINAHGTSTSFNDKIESLAINKLFGAWAKEGLAVSSTKSMTGHLLGAAGAVEAAFSVLAIKDGILPPTINLDSPGEGCDLDYVPHIARRCKIRAAMSNSFGFGGTNAAVIFKAFN